ncbi:unnamed protein product [Parnassius mnemosyne]|uniref:RING-type E3 ubiquitin transferase n=1 Tax=Parnassius mnemosyne TaxID=213953 RepID=A0AAV1KYV1_9NEOP
MSLREEERQKNGCSSRGLGLAAAAIGVGVGAALYYFFSKSPENPHSEGSTASGWQTETLNCTNCDQTQRNMDVDSDDYTTISEDVTSDTSIVSSADEDFNCSYSSRDTFNETIVTVDSSESNNSLSEQYVTDTDYSDSDMDDHSDTSLEQHSGSDNSTYNSNFSERSAINQRSANNSYETGYVMLTLRTTMNSSSSSSNSDEIQADEWVVVDEGLSEYTRGSRSPIHRIGEEQAIQRDQAFRERSWTLEECSICFEVMLRDQELMTLPCTHHFHQACILPWLQEQGTCPNCRKRAE